MAQQAKKSKARSGQGKRKKRRGAGGKPQRRTQTVSAKGKKAKAAATGSSVNKIVELAGLAVRGMRSQGRAVGSLQRSGRIGGLYARKAVRSLLKAIRIAERFGDRYAAFVGRVLVGGFQFCGERVLTALAYIARAAFRNLKPDALASHHQSGLLFLHRAVFDGGFEKYLFVPTKDHTDPEQLSAARPNNAKRRPSAHIPSQVFRWSLRALSQDVSQHTFVQFGAGRGRGLLLASQHNFKKVTGCEFAQPLFEDALLNIAQFPRSLMKCRDVECLNLSAADMPIPTGPAVLYFFQPFDQEAFACVLKNAEESFRRVPRPLYIVTLDYDVDKHIEAENVFQPVRLGLGEELLFRIASPYAVRVYETVKSRQYRTS